MRMVVALIVERGDLSLTELMGYHLGKHRSGEHLLFQHNDLGLFNS